MKDIFEELNELWDYEIESGHKYEAQARELQKRGYTVEATSEDSDMPDYICAFKDIDDINIAICNEYGPGHQVDRPVVTVNFSNADDNGYTEQEFDAFVSAIKQAFAEANKDLNELF